MNAVTDGIFNAPIAAVSTNRKINQNTTLPISAAGLAPGLIFATYWPLAGMQRVIELGLPQQRRDQRLDRPRDEEPDDQNQQESE
jgi:hypothetical protein